MKNFWRSAAIVRLSILGVTACGVCMAQSDAIQSVPQANSSYIDEQGTAHITRVVPVPKTISSEAQKLLARRVSDAPNKETLAERREKTDKWQNGAGQESRKLYPATVEEQLIAGVRTRIVAPAAIAPDKQDRLLINIHGGGFNSDSGSLTETIPIASLTQTKVVAVLYRLAPEHPFPAAIDDVVAVYKEMLKTYKPAKIAIYGTSAGAVITAEVAVKLKQAGLPLPGALGIFSGFGDFSKVGDSRTFFSLGGFSGPLELSSGAPSNGSSLNAYVGATSVTDPVLSPVLADLHGMPPTLFITSTRDLLLSGTATLHRAFLHAGIDAQMVVFEALPHAFWNSPQLPESKEADKLMADFFNKALDKK